MTLGSKLSVGARPHWRQVCRLSLGGQRSFAHSPSRHHKPADADADAVADTVANAAVPPGRPRPARSDDGQVATSDPAAPYPSSLVERLARVPVRPYGPRDSVVVPPVTRVPAKRETYEELQRNHRNLTQQRRLERNRRRSTPGDWRLVLQNLLDASPIYTTPEDEVKVVIPNESVKLLLADGPNNIWNIRSRTRCNVELYPGEVSPQLLSDGRDGSSQGGGGGSEAYLVLSGQPTAVAVAVDDILSVTKRVTIAKPHGETDTLLHPEQADGRPSREDLLRSIPSRSQPPITIHDYPASVRRSPYDLFMRADKIPHPKAWTTETFMQYVAALVLGRPSPGHFRMLYREGEQHKDVVVKQLLAAFENPDASAAVSSPSLKMALAYLVRSGESLVPHAQKLFDRAVALGLRLDADVYNLMAETGVKAKNMIAFESMTRLMITHGHQPNLRTWILFLRIIEAEEVRRYILQAMHTKNLFADPAAVISVSNEMAEQDAYRAIQLGYDLDTFLAAQRELYGPEWRLTRNAANKMLHVFGRQGRFRESKQLLDVLFASKHDRPNAITLNIILTHCKHQTNIREAIDVLRMFDERGHRVADLISYQLLFEIAYRKKWVHIASVVWRYAHLVDATTFRLRSRGLMLLSGGKEVEMLTRRIAGFWAGEAEHKRTRHEFVENLLLCDYKNQSHQPSAELLSVGRRPVRHRDKDSDSFAILRRPAPLLRWPATNPRPPAPDEAPIFPADMAPADRYAAYKQWTTALSHSVEPSEPLSKLLQQALELDEEMRFFARRPGASLAERDGMPIFMWPIEIPLGPRRGSTRFKPFSYEVEYDEAAQEENLPFRGNDRWRMLRMKEMKDPVSRSLAGLAEERTEQGSPAEGESK
ncbi:hypothetical protein VTK26DRAFT_1411 [Humicola hyalothermophila]